MGLCTVVPGIDIVDKICDRTTNASSNGASSLPRIIIQNKKGATISSKLNA